MVHQKVLVSASQNFRSLQSAWKFSNPTQPVWNGLSRLTDWKA